MPSVNISFYLTEEEYKKYLKSKAKYNYYLREKLKEIVEKENKEI